MIVNEASPASSSSLNMFVIADPTPSNAKMKSEIIDDGLPKRVGRTQQGAGGGTGRAGPSARRTVVPAHFEALRFVTSERGSGLRQLLLSKNRSFHLARFFFGDLFLYPSARLTAGIRDVGRTLLDESHARAVDVLLFWGLDDRSVNHLLGGVKIDSSLVPGSLATGD